MILIAVVIGLSAGVDFSSSQSGSTLTVRLKGAGHVAQTSQVGRRVLGMEGGDGVFSIRMAPGTHARIFRVGDRLVIDVAAGGGAGIVAGTRRLPPHRRRRRVPPAKSICGASRRVNCRRCRRRALPSPRGARSARQRRCCRSRPWSCLPRQRTLAIQAAMPARVLLPRPFPRQAVRPRFPWRLRQCPSLPQVLQPRRRRARRMRRRRAQIRRMPL